MPRRTSVNSAGTWTGIAVCVAVVALACVSLRWRIEYGFQRGYVSLRRGSIVIHYWHRGAGPGTASVFSKGWKLKRAAGPYQWKFGGESGGWYDRVTIPQWAVAGPALGVLAVVVGRWARRRWGRRPWQCRWCGYDKRGLPAGGAPALCPECGR